jgi:hypothetical protein
MGPRHALEDKGAEVVEGTGGWMLRADECLERTELIALIRVVCTDLHQRGQLYRVL